MSSDNLDVVYVHPIAALTRTSIMTRARILRCKLWSKRGQKGSENSQEKVQKKVLLKSLY
jgi:hypothetical protein